MAFRTQFQRDGIGDRHPENDLADMEVLADLLNEPEQQPQGNAEMEFRSGGEGQRGLQEGVHRYGIRLPTLEESQLGRVCRNP